MADGNSHSHEADERSRQSAPQVESLSTSDLEAEEPVLSYTPYILGDSRIGAKGNAPVRADMMQRAQQTHGNRAVQRFLNNSASAPRSIQRDIFDGLGIGDWKILPPTPKTETDDTYDDAEKQRREQRKIEDERGKSATPEEWWKPKPAPDLKAPPPWMPKIKVKEQGESDTPIPPKGPDERGDYPIPPWPEGEGYA